MDKGYCAVPPVGHWLSSAIGATARTVRLVLLILWGGLILMGAAPASNAAPAGAVVEFPHAQIVLVTKAGASYPLSVEVASTPEQRSQGLMFRHQLAEGTGMLFDFGNSMVVRMWMKNTLIPLDMLFFDAKGAVVGVVANAKPHDLTPLGPDQPVAMVLELPGGQAARWGIEVGDQLMRP